MGENSRKSTSNHPLYGMTVFISTDDQSDIPTDYPLFPLIKIEIDFAYRPDIGLHPSQRQYPH